MATKNADSMGTGDRNTQGHEANQDESIERIASEEEDQDNTPQAFEVVTYPADYTLEVLVKKLAKDPPEIQIPGFQRKYVWSVAQASRLIESFLLGLPVPAIFLYTDSENIQLAVDGQQRLKSIAYFFEGFFGPETKGKRPVFRLAGLNDKSPFLGKTYKDLESTLPAAYRKLNDAVLRAFVIKQLDPKDNTSIFYTFERLNTGGTLLKGQEIRNCVYAGPFNELLAEMNENFNWRKVYGRVESDKRQRDIELILRFLALRFNSDEYKRPMKDFLSEFMRINRKADEATLKQYSDAFARTSEAVFSHLGEKPFHIRTGFNAAVFDSVFLAFAASNTIPSDAAARYQKLKGNDAFLNVVTVHTTNEDAIRERLRIAESILFGAIE